MPRFSCPALACALITVIEARHLETQQPPAPALAALDSADFGVKFANSSPDPRGTSDRARLARRIPHLLQLELDRNRGGLREARDTAVDGARVTRLAVSLPGDTAVAWIDLSRPHWRVTCVGHHIEAAGLGPTEVTYRYGGCRPHAVLGAVPATLSVHRWKAVA